MYRRVCVWRHTEQALWLQGLQRNLSSLLHFIQTWITLNQASRDYSLSLMTKEQAGGLELPTGTWMKRQQPGSAGAPSSRQSCTADSQGTVRPGKKSSFTLVSISYAFPWSSHWWPLSNKNDQTLTWHSMALLRCFYIARVWLHRHAHQQTSAFSTATSSSRSWSWYQVCGI